MSTPCEFRNCSNTSDDIKINRLRIHENLSKKWEQVFNDSLNDRIGEYLYICRAHFDSNTKKLILPKPNKNEEEVETVTQIVKKEVIISPNTSVNKSASKRKAVPSSTQSVFFNDEDEDEPLIIKKKTTNFESYMPEQMFIAMDAEEELIPEIKEEEPDDSGGHDELYKEQPSDEEENQKIFPEPVLKERSPIKHGPNYASIIPESMSPNVLLSPNLTKIRKSSKLAQDKIKYQKLKKELDTLKTELDNTKSKNEFLKRDIMITLNRINFIESNFGGMPSKRNDPYLQSEIQKT